MPTNRRKRTATRRRTLALDKRTEIRLLTGSDFEFLDDWQPARTMDELGALWRRYRGALIARHQAEKGLFQRPWGWWQFEAPPDAERGPGWHFEETQKPYLIEHPNLLTPEEKNHLSQSKSKEI